MYDSEGNRVEYNTTLGGVTTKKTATFYHNALAQEGDTFYTYDTDGYLQSKNRPEGTTSYMYGTLGELRSVVTPEQTITYIHNANNQRVAKLIDGVIVEKYLWLNLTTLLATYDANDNLINRYYYANQRLPYKMTHNSKTYYLSYNHLGSLRVVSDTNGNVVKEISYDAYGSIINDSNQTLEVSFGFAGGLYDPDTKLTRFGYRDYDANTGKWTAKDPIGFQGGDTNLYGYVLGDPVNAVDPNGEFALNSEAFYQIGLNGAYNSFYGGFYANMAWNGTEILFPGENPGLNNPNAFRHCYWSCLMANEIGKESALNIGAVHEVCGDNDDTDMWNNWQGANMQSSNCAQSCMNALQEGKLK